MAILSKIILLLPLNVVLLRFANQEVSVGSISGLVLNQNFWI